MYTYFWYRKGAIFTTQPSRRLVLGALHAGVLFSLQLHDGADWRQVLANGKALEQVSIFDSNTPCEALHILMTVVVRCV